MHLFKQTELDATYMHIDGTVAGWAELHESRLTL